MCVCVCTVAYFRALRGVNKLRTAVDLISKRRERKQDARRSLDLLFHLAAFFLADSARFPIKKWRPIMLIGFRELQL